MTWLYEGREVCADDTNDYVGFVYLITNLISDRKYIGKKLLKFRRSKTVKGRKKKILIDSDWETYYGSSKELLKDVEELGAKNFKREILQFCKTRGYCNYLEAMYQFQYRVLETSDWYNSNIMVRVHRSHLKKIVDSAFNI